MVASYLAALNLAALAVGFMAWVCIGLVHHVRGEQQAFEHQRSLIAMVKELR